VAFGYLQNPGYCGSPMLQTEGSDTFATASTASTRMEVNLRRLLSSEGASEASDGSSSSSSGVITGTIHQMRKMLEGWGILRAGLSAAKTIPAVPGKQQQQQQHTAGCTVFPVVIGETGSNFASATDRQWLQDFADYIMAVVSVRAHAYAGAKAWIWHVCVRDTEEADFCVWRGGGGTRWSDVSGDAIDGSGPVRASSKQHLGSAFGASHSGQKIATTCLCVCVHDAVIVAVGRFDSACGE
jgi:hypothetical protein